MTSDTVAVCPECDTAKVGVNNVRRDGPSYYCGECNATFDEPRERERKVDSGTRAGLAGELAAIGEREYPEKGDS